MLHHTDLEKIDVLDVVILAGEACRNATINHHYALGLSSRLYNEYGPTEACVWSSVYHIEAARDDVVPIGKAIGNSYLEIYNHHGYPCPPGVVGELYIGGDGLSPGYLNDAGQITNCYIHEAVSEDDSTRLYKTGDLAYFNARNELVYAGRIDRQLKIRGYRIEPGEVEAALEGHDEILEALVVGETAELNSQSEEASPRSEAWDRTPNSERMLLVAYYLTNAPPGLVNESTECVLIDGIAKEELKRHCESLLPVHMRPSHYVAVNRFPRLPNGKIAYAELETLRKKRVGDKTALEVAEIAEVDKTYGQTLSTLTEVLGNILLIDDVRADDNFFEIGGDSITCLLYTSPSPRDS